MATVDARAGHAVFIFCSACAEMRKTKSVGQFLHCFEECVDNVAMCYDLNAAYASYLSVASTRTRFESRSLGASLSLSKARKKIESGNRDLPNFAMPRP